MSTPGNLQAENCIIVIFGASGDLTSRKLVPALYDLHRQGRLPPKVCILGVARREKSDSGWRDELFPSVKKHSANFDEAKWKEFSQRIFYHAGDGSDPEAMKPLGDRCNQIGKDVGIVKGGEGLMEIDCGRLADGFNCGDQEATGAGDQGVGSVGDPSG